MRRIVNILVWAIVLFLAPAVAFAADGGGGSGIGGLGIGAGLAVGLAGLGCGIGQGLTAGNTTAGIARHPGAARPAPPGSIEGVEALLAGPGLAVWVLQPHPPAILRQHRLKTAGQAQN